MGSFWLLSFLLFHLFFLSCHEFCVLIEHIQHSLCSIIWVLWWRLPRIVSHAYNRLQLSNIRFYFSLLEKRVVDLFQPLFFKLLQNFHLVQRVGLIWARSLPFALFPLLSSFNHRLLRLVGFFRKTYVTLLRFLITLIWWLVHFTLHSLKVRAKCLKQHRFIVLLTALLQRC